MYFKFELIFLDFVQILDFINRSFFINVSYSDQYIHSMIDYHEFLLTMSIIPYIE